MRATAAVVALLALAALLAVGALRASSGIRSIGAASAELVSLQPMLEELQAGYAGDLASLQGTLGRIQAEIRSGKGMLRPWLQVAPALGWVPKVGRELKSSRDLLDVGERFERISFE